MATSFRSAIFERLSALYCFPDPGVPPVVATSFKSAIFERLSALYCFPDPGVPPAVAARWPQATTSQVPPTLA